MNDMCGIEARFVAPRWGLFPFCPADPRAALVPRLPLYIRFSTDARRGKQCVSTGAPARELALSARAEASAHALPLSGRE